MSFYASYCTSPGQEYLKTEVIKRWMAVRCLVVFLSFFYLYTVV